MKQQTAREARERGKNFRTLLWAFLGLCVFGACSHSGSVRESGYIPGLYTGTGRGYRGPLEVQVRVSRAGIEDAEIISHRERGRGAAALEQLLEAVLESGSADVDVVSGATFSSEGFIEAVEDAMGRTRGSTLRESLPRPDR